MECRDYSKEVIPVITETNKVTKQHTVFMSARMQFSGIVLGIRQNYGLDCMHFLIIWFCVFVFLRLLYFLFLFSICAYMHTYASVHVCVLLTLRRVSEDLGLGLLLNSCTAYKLGIAFLTDVSEQEAR